MNVLKLIHVLIKAFPHNHTIIANYLKYFHDVENKIKDNKFANHQ